MAKKEVEFPDVFMQFRTIAHTHHANDHQVLTEAFIETGLEIRGRMAWLVHQIELEFAHAPIVVSNVCRWGVSTRRGQPVMPTYGDRGCLLKQGYFAGGSGGAGALAYGDMTQKVEFRPPVIIASRYIASYFEMDADEAILDGLTSYLRIGFTTIKMSPADYVEVAETWGE